MMVGQEVLGLTLLLTTTLTPAQEALGAQTRGEILSQSPIYFGQIFTEKEEILAEQELDLMTRAEEENVNEVFKFNILHALEFIGESLVLEPGEVFAFHENIAKEFETLPIKTSGTKYIAREGYEAVGGLYGNGVCHLASLMNWVATEAGLEVTAPTNHDFAPIPGVSEEYGTSIRYQENGGANSQNQNLYIRNNFDLRVEFVFEVEENFVNLQILK